MADPAAATITQLKNIQARTQQGLGIAVGMPIAEHPPHRSGHAQFTHPAPTLGV